MSDTENENKENQSQEEEEEVKQEPPHPATKEQIQAGLSSIQRIHGKSFIRFSWSLIHLPSLDGSSYAFAALTIEESDPPIEDLGNLLQPYEHLQHLHLSKNGIRDIATIGYLPHLLTVNVGTNAVASIKFLQELADSDRLQFLQVSSYLAGFKLL